MTRPDSARLEFESWMGQSGKLLPLSHVEVYTVRRNHDSDWTSFFRGRTMLSLRSWKLPKRSLTRPKNRIRSPRTLMFTQQSGQNRWFFRSTQDPRSRSGVGVCVCDTQSQSSVWDDRSGHPGMVKKGSRHLFRFHGVYGVFGINLPRRSVHSPTGPSKPI